MKFRGPHTTMDRFPIYEIEAELPAELTAN
jgi:hypothetical protein